jgi:hypothetical protein
MLPTQVYHTFAEKIKTLPSNKHETHQKVELYKGEKQRSLSKVRVYFLFIRYSFMALAAFLPMPIALITVAAPVATSPPA